MIAMMAWKTTVHSALSVSVLRTAQVSENELRYRDKLTLGTRKNVEANYKLSAHGGPVNEATY